jgi:hypothetical protein
LYTQEPIVKQAVKELKKQKARVEKHVGPIEGLYPAQGYKIIADKLDSLALRCDELADLIQSCAVAPADNPERPIRLPNY